MDVRCERCRAQYVFEDDQITPAGLTVQCNACGHVFRVQKKELVVTRSVTPGELDEPPVPASSATPPHQPLPPPAPPPAPVPVAAPPLAADATSHWTIRQASGQSLSFTELNTLQRWIVERKVSREDEVTQGDGAWVRLGTLAELQSFFEVVEAADRAHGRSTSRYPPAPYPPPNYAPPPQYAPLAPAYVPPPPGYGPPPAYAPPPAPSPAPQPPPPRTFSADSVQIELDEADLRAVGKSKGPRSAIVVVLLLLVAGAAVAYVFMPALFGRAPPPKPEPVAVPLTITMKTPEPPAPPPPPPEPTPEPPAAKAPEPTPEAKPKPKAASLKQQLAEAKRLRENNKSEQALDIYGRITAEDPENVEALAGRGLCYFDLEQYAPAEASLQEALRLSPTQGDALLGLAETYRAMGRKAEAIAMFEKYLAAYPGGDEAAVARNAINQLKE
jgi:predicted Zn finger-like uncharacterized protein